MDIGIVTHYSVYNHGALLQLYALITILRNEGHNVYALKFDKDYRFLDNAIKNKYKISIKSIPYYMKYLNNYGINKTMYNIRKKQIFDKFLKQNNIMGKNYYEFTGDLIIVGSDEVFSIENGLTNAFFGLNSNCKNISAYSASFGPTDIMDIQQKGLEEYLEKAFTNFRCISARDMNTKKIIESLSDKKIELTCDPVILYGYKAEIQNTKIEENTDYILLYSYDKNMNEKNEIEMIMNISNKLNMPVYSVGFYHEWCDKNINASPIELLGYFRESRFIITDTFHGTVLSLISNSKFATYIRGNYNKLYNLLYEYKMEDRLFHNENECISLYYRKIQYNKINALMDYYRKKSFAYLKSILVEMSNV